MISAPKPTAPSFAQPPRLRGTLAYAAMLGLTVATVCSIIRFGQGQEIALATSAGVASPEAGKPSILLHVLLTLAAVVVAGQILGIFFRYVGQPPVIGEVVAGIMLGPSLLGRVWPEASAFLMPVEVGPYVAVIAQIGVILYMFLVGLELNPAVLKERAGNTLFIAHGSMALPFVAGAGLGLFLYPRLAYRAHSPVAFILFMGISLSVTAFPVLARILTDRHLQSTPLGIIALGAAAAGDVTAWCILAFVVGIAQSAVDRAVLTFLLTLVFIAVVLVVVRPVLLRIFLRHDSPTPAPLLTAAMLVAVFSSAMLTEAIGIHALFGAFLLGAIIPDDSQLAKAFRHKFEDLVTLLLLPAFFASVGMRTEIGLVSGLENWLICGLISLVAMLGKFMGTYAAARFTGLDRRNATGLGVLMNTRGLMELIVLSVGLEMKVLSPTLFAMMVLMALATTLLTGPALAFVYPREAVSPA
jgi:Kef-type K+ transport system membrane component KefB